MRFGVIPTRQGYLNTKQIRLVFHLSNPVFSSSWRTFLIIAQFSVSCQYHEAIYQDMPASSDNAEQILASECFEPLLAAQYEVRYREQSDICS